MAIAYGVIFALSLLMIPLYFTCIRKKKDEPWLLVLFLCIATVNLGYFLLSLSKTVELALWANKLAYLGQVFVPTCMLMIISKLCGFTYRKWVVGVLLALAAVMFGIVFTTGWLDCYYVSATLEFENGGAYLVKEYGVLHPTNLVYVVSYFLAMLIVIAVSLKKRKAVAQKVAGLMLAVVLGNIAMWLIEKVISWHFEMLAVSYLMSEMVFFFVYFVLQDYVHVKEIPPSVSVEERVPVIIVDSMPKAEKVQAILSALPEGVTLSARQMDVLEGILDGKSRKTIAADLCLSENTVKMHTSALYRLLDVSSREEIFALLKK